MSYSFPIRKRLLRLAILALLHHIFLIHLLLMFDIDSLADMYETMIDRGAFVYDSLSNLTYSLTKNFTSFCSFFINQLNYTYEQCEYLINNTIINMNQIRENKQDYLCIF
jgi:hypothetical protein